MAHTGSLLLRWESWKAYGIAVYHIGFQRSPLLPNNRHRGYLTAKRRCDCLVEVSAGWEAEPPRQCVPRQEPGNEGRVAVAEPKRRHGWVGKPMPPLSAFEWANPRRLSGWTRCSSSAVASLRLRHS